MGLNKLVPGGNRMNGRSSHLDEASIQISIVSVRMRVAAAAQLWKGFVIRLQIFNKHSGPMAIAARQSHRQFPTYLISVSE
jgi:hypothetical protein